MSKQTARDLIAAKIIALREVAVVGGEKIEDAIFSREEIRADGRIGSSVKFDDIEEALKISNGRIFVDIQDAMHKHSSVSLGLKGVNRILAIELLVRRLDLTAIPFMPRDRLRDRIPVVNTVVGQWEAVRNPGGMRLTEEYETAMMKLIAAIFLIATDGFRPKDVSTAKASIITVANNVSTALDTGLHSKFSGIFNNPTAVANRVRRNMSVVAYIDSVYPWARRNRVEYMPSLDSTSPFASHSGGSGGDGREGATEFSNFPLIQDLVGKRPENLAPMENEIPSPSGSMTSDYKSLCGRNHVNDRIAKPVLIRILSALGYDTDVDLLMKKSREQICDIFASIHNEVKHIIIHTDASAAAGGGSGGNPAPRSCANWNGADPIASAVNNIHTGGIASVTGVLSLSKARGIPGSSIIVAFDMPEYDKDAKRTRVCVSGTAIMKPEILSFINDINRIGSMQQHRSGQLGVSREQQIYVKFFIALGQQIQLVNNKLATPPGLPNNFAAPEKVKAAMQYVHYVLSSIVVNGIPHVDDSETIYMAFDTANIKVKPGLGLEPIRFYVLILADLYKVCASAIDKKLVVGQFFGIKRTQTVSPSKTVAISTLQLLIGLATWLYWHRRLDESIAEWKNVQASGVSETIARVLGGKIGIDPQTFKEYTNIDPKSVPDLFARDLRALPA